MLSDPTNYWVIFSLVVFALIVACAMIYFLPLCRARFESDDASLEPEETPSPTLDARLGNQVQAAPRRKGGSTRGGRSPGSPFNISALFNRGSVVRKRVAGSFLDDAEDPAPMRSTQPGIVDEPLVAVLQAIQRQLFTVKIVLLFKMALEFLLFIITVIYPPWLWFLWMFLPSNSTVILGILFLGVELMTTVVVYDGLPLLEERWLHKLDQYTKDGSARPSPAAFVLAFKSELVFQVFKPWAVILLIYLYILLRMLFMFIGSTILWLDGSGFLIVMATINLLFCLFSFLAVL